MLGLGLGLLHTRPAAGGFIQAFLSRVKKDGGTTEGASCIRKKLNAYPNQEESRVLMDAYIVRVQTAGGTVEAKQCAINEINDL